MPPGSIRSLFRDYGGHHIFPLAEALLRGNLLSADAVDVLSKNTIGSDGQLKDQQDPANPHRGFNKPQREYSVAVREFADQFMKENSIDRNNPMTGEQAQRLVKALETSLMADLDVPAQEWPNAAKLRDKLKRRTPR